MPKTVPPTPRMSMKQLVQQQRDELYASGHQNLNMALSERTIHQIDLMKKRYRLRSRDQVVARIIRKGSTIDPGSFVQRATDPDAEYRRISPIVSGELATYMKKVQRRFRNIGYGPVFEMILGQVGDDLANSVMLPERVRDDL